MAAEDAQNYLIKIAPLAYVKVLISTLQYRSNEGEKGSSNKIAGIFTGNRVGKDLTILNFYYLQELGEKDLDITAYPEILTLLKNTQQKFSKTKDSEGEREVLGWLTSTNAGDFTLAPVHLKTQYFMQAEVSEELVGALFAPTLLDESYGLTFFSLKGDFRYITEFSPVIKHEYMLTNFGDSEKIYDLLIELNASFHDKERKVLIPPLGGT